MKDPKVYSVDADLCKSGLVTRGVDGKLLLAKKTTRFMSSAPAILERLGLKCQCGHVHQHFVDGRAKVAAIYTPMLCRAMIQGEHEQMEREGGGGAPRNLLNELDAGCAIFNLGENGDKIELGESSTGEPPHENEAYEQYYGGWWEQPDWDQTDASSGKVHSDNLTEGVLPEAMVRHARDEELELMEDWGVWDVVDVSEAVRVIGKPPLGGRWVDVDKGDSENPNVRCRYVAKEIAYFRDDGLFAAMPPLESLRMLVSHLATDRQQGSKGLKMLVVHARKAHLHVTPTRDIYIALPPERHQPGKCAKLRRCLHGTRDAPARWEAYLTEHLEKLGFQLGVASTCCFKHATRDLRCVVHGDDFVCVGSDADLQWVRKDIEPNILLKVVGKLGPDQTHLQDIRVLNRILRWQDDGVRYEADTRHAVLLAGDFEAPGPAVKTLGAKGSQEEIEGSKPLNTSGVKLFKTAAVRASCLAMDRADLGYSAKELCRRMAAPTRHDWCSLHRIVKYLKNEPRLVYHYQWQQNENAIRVFVDTNFVGCLLTRKSTSGGCAMRDSHLIKHWISTQKVVTLSSGEAELTGIVKGVVEAIGIWSLSADLGWDSSLKIFADSSVQEVGDRQGETPCGGPALGPGAPQDEGLRALQGLRHGQPSRHPDETRASGSS